MPIRFKYDAERELLINIGEGSIGIEDIDALREERRQAGIPQSVRHTLSDMRGAHFDFDIATLKEHEVGLSEEEFAGNRQVEIVDDPRTTAFLLSWRRWLPEGVLVEVVSSPEAAYEWLGVEWVEGDLD